MSNAKKYTQIFDYMRDPVIPTEVSGNFVFGRADPLLAKKMGDLYVAGLADYFLVTGGIGKDSGPLAEKKIPEAVYINQLAQDRHGIPGEKIIMEVNARNGGENVRYGIGTLRTLGHNPNQLTVVSHATSLRRLAGMLDHEGGGVHAASRVPTDYKFDANNPADQQEARDELLRMHEWPAKGWLPNQPDLPMDLVDFAADQRAKTQS